MAITREKVVKWLDAYFVCCNESQGTVDSVSNLARYFASDFKFWMFTPPPFFAPPLSREEFLMLFVHPGLHEALRPQHYVVDVQAMMVVVKFEFEFLHQDSGRTWAPLQASAHYHLVPDADPCLKIKMIEYWTQSSPEDRASLFDAWLECRQKGLVEYATRGFRVNAAQAS